MLDRDDLTFATCYQLAGEIREEWEERPAQVSQALVVLDNFHEPDYIYDHTQKLQRLAACRVIAEAIKLILTHSDSWKTVKADMIKKELISRIKEYEKQIDEFVNPRIEQVSVRL